MALISRSQHLHPTNCTFDVKVSSSGRGYPSTAAGASTTTPVDVLLGLQLPRAAAVAMRTHTAGAAISRMHPAYEQTQVHNAELAGAVAAIVYDDVYEALIIMSKPRDHPEPGIPAVFVSEKAGIIMRKLMTPGVTRVRIVPVRQLARVCLCVGGGACVCCARVQAGPGRLRPAQRAVCVLLLLLCMCLLAALNSWQH